MRAVVQRVSRAAVRVDGSVVGEIAGGLCVLVGALQGDSEQDAAFIANKLATLRVFPDAEQRMNLDVRQAGGAVLLVSQFTLAADTTSGTRPSFSAALAPAEAEALISFLSAQLAAAGLQVHGGRFGAHMELELVNDGPVTILLDSRNKRRK